MAEVAFIVVGFLLALSTAVAIGFFTGRYGMARWQALEKALGFAAAGPHKWWKEPPVLEGRHGARAAALTTYQRGSGNHRERWTDVRVFPRVMEPDFTLRVSRENVAAKLAKAIGGEDVEMGDPDFDKRYRVQASDPDVARRILDLFVQEAFDGLEPFGEMRVEAGRIWVTRKGLMKDPEEVLRKLTVLSRIADAVERTARDEK